jgi:hypothetical protein
MILCCPPAEAEVEILLQLAVELVVEVVGQVLVELLASLGWRSLADAVRPERHAHPALATVGQFALGALTGGLSLLVVGHRLLGPSPLPGASLILSPLGTGVAMHALGRMWPARLGDRPGLLSFGSGAVFAFGMALVRFLYLEDPWQWWPE